MDLKITGDWQYPGDDYSTQYAETNDPRVLAVIQMENDYDDNLIDGDAYAPAFYWDRRYGGLEQQAGSTFMDAESVAIAERIVQARGRFYDLRQPWSAVERYARIFHATSLEQVSSNIDRDTQVVIFNTPSWREHVGNPDATASGDVESWQAALDGEVYGIGWATLNERVTDETDIEFPDWDVEIQVWGYIGEDYAKASAADFEAGTPDLPALLDIPA